MSKQHIKQLAVAVVAVLALSGAAFAQGQGPRGAVAAATESFGFTDEQMEQIRDIRNERAPRDQSREEREAWAAERRSKINAVLTDEQKAKVAQLNEMRAQMRDFAVAARMGLIDAPGRSGFAAGPRGGNRARSNQGWGGPGRGRGFAPNRGNYRGPGGARGGHKGRRGQRR